MCVYVCIYVHIYICYTYMFSIFKNNTPQTTPM